MIKLGQKVQFIALTMYSQSFIKKKCVNGHVTSIPVTEKQILIDPTGFNL